MKRRLSALLCALTLALSLSGCWSGDVSDDSSGDFWEETPPVEADTSSTLTPITSFALPYLQGVTLDPITCPDGMQQTLGALLYEGLFVLNESFAPQNVLCSRYEHNDDCTSYTFYLRDGVSFSDGKRCARDASPRAGERALQRALCQRRLDAHKQRRAHCQSHARGQRIPRAA